ncbi:Universal stress protein A-like protein [Vitis vinifera]|uniref:Universal stress protein A-like protein n=1 Tax=Vitis vinifera TaxID=29760 RepID=A0A438IXL6_VITVI|nr:Universal stress protein A-like protein [Vitis vinifera]
MGSLMEEEVEKMRKEKRIVVAVDESEESMYALSWCLTNLVSDANKTKSTLILLYVKPPPPLYNSLDAAGEKFMFSPFFLCSISGIKPVDRLFLFLLVPTGSSGYLFANDVVGAMEKYGWDLVNSVMARAEAVFKDFSSIMSVEKKVGTGDAKDVICGAVEKLGADILVMGSHDYGFFKRALLGSVSDHCAKHVKCPVVVVKRPRD